MAGPYCPRCGFQNSPGRSACLLCYEFLSDETGGSTCPNPACGHSNPADAKFCQQCGTGYDPSIVAAPTLLEAARAVINATGGAAVGQTEQPGAYYPEESGGDFLADDDLGGTGDVFSHGVPEPEAPPPAPAPPAPAAPAPAAAEEEDFMPPTLPSIAAAPAVAAPPPPPPPPPAPAEEEEEFMPPPLPSIAQAPPPPPPPAAPAPVDVDADLGAALGGDLGGFGDFEADLAAPPPPPPPPPAAPAETAAEAAPEAGATPQQKKKDDLEIVQDDEDDFSSWSLES